MGKILLAGEEPQKRPPLLRNMIANRPAQHGIARLERVHHRTLRDRPLNIHLHLAGDVRQAPQVLRKQTPDHGRVCTSTESTAGRSRTTGAHVSPASAEPY